MRLRAFIELRVVFVALAALAVAFAAPRAASATCGDYLKHGEGRDTSATRGAPHAPIAPKCSGPSCRQAPAMPVAPQERGAAEVRSRAEASFDFLSTADRAAEGRTYLSPATSRALQGHPLGILRPPDFIAAV